MGRHASIGAWPLWRSGAQARQICHPLGALPSKYHTLCVLLLARLADLEPLPKPLPSVVSQHFE